MRSIEDDYRDLLTRGSASGPDTWVWDDADEAAWHADPVNQAWMDRIAALAERDGLRVASGIGAGDVMITNRVAPSAWLLRPDGSRYARRDRAETESQIAADWGDVLTSARARAALAA